MYTWELVSRLGSTPTPPVEIKKKLEGSQDIPLLPSIGRKTHSVVVVVTLSCLSLMPLPHAPVSCSLNASLQHVVNTKGRGAASEILQFEEQAAAQTLAFVEQTDGMRVGAELDERARGVHALVGNNSAYQVQEWP